MRKTIITMLATTAIAFSAISPVQAQTVDTDTDASVSSELSSGTSSGSSEDSEDSDLSNRDIIFGIAAIAAVGGLIAGGVHWAVQQRMIPNPLPGIIPNPPALAPQAPAPAPAPALPLRQSRPRLSLPKLSRLRRLPYRPTAPTKTAPKYGTSWEGPSAKAIQATAHTSTATATASAANHALGSLGFGDLRELRRLLGPRRS